MNASTLDPAHGVDDERSGPLHVSVVTVDVLQLTDVQVRVVRGSNTAEETHAEEKNTNVLHVYDNKHYTIRFIVSDLINTIF